MDDLSNRRKAVELLQELGLKEYEARAFVALARLPQATAKEISETSDVPRTRVYDAIRVLETKGLVEIQHSSPQVFRAVSITEATRTLRKEYEERTEQLEETLRGLEPGVTEEKEAVAHEVWTLSGTTAITNRTEQLIDEAEAELLFVIGHADVVTDRLLERLQGAHRRGVTVVVGTADETSRERVRAVLPDTTVFVSELEWLESSPLPDDETEISCLLLVDHSTILISTFHETPGGERDEQAVFGRGFDNGLVAIARRLMATGLLPSDDPERTDRNERR